MFNIKVLFTGTFKDYYSFMLQSRTIWYRTRHYSLIIDPGRFPACYIHVFKSFLYTKTYCYWGVYEKVCSEKAKFYPTNNWKKNLPIGLFFCKWYEKHYFNYFQIFLKDIYNLILYPVKCVFRNYDIKCKMMLRNPNKSSLTRRHCQL